MNHIPDVFQTGAVPLCGAAGDTVAAPATCPECIEAAETNRPVYWPWLPAVEGAS